jgi:hypothetical protein
MENIAGALEDLGNASEALRDRRLKRGERHAIRMTVAAVAWLQKRFGTAGVDDAGNGVELVLRSGFADVAGPYAEWGRITVPNGNVINGKSKHKATRGRVLPRDVALHELVHVIQFAQLGRDWEKLHGGIAEGLADTVAMLATRDWRIGESYWTKQDKAVIRDVGGRRGKQRHGDPVVFDWRKVAKGKVEEHAAGAVVARTFYEIQRKLGWRRAEDLVMGVIKDHGAWLSGGSWKQLAESLPRIARQLWPMDAAAQEVVVAAMRSTHLDEAIPGGVLGPYEPHPEVPA